MGDALKRRRFERLVRPELEALYRTAYRVVGHRALAEEAAQDACMKAYAHFDPANEPREFRPWLFRILMNRCVDIARRNRREAMHVANPVPKHHAPDLSLSSQPLRIVETHEIARALDQALGQLTLDLRAVVTLVLIEEMTYAEAASSLDISQDLVRSRLARARTSLKQALVIVHDVGDARCGQSMPLSLDIVATKRDGS